MRSYENSGYNPYNENNRSQSRSSARNYYSDENDLTNRMQRAHGSNTRGSMGMGSGRDSSATSGYGGTSTYGRSAGSSNYGSGYGSDYGSSDSNRYGSSDYGSSSSRYDNDSNRYGRNSNRSNEDWGDKIENTWERTKDRASNAWDNMTGDDDRDNYSRNRDSYRGSSQNRGGYGSSNYVSGMGTGSSYGTGSGYGSGSNYGSSNYGSGSGYGGSSYGSGSGNYGSSNYGSGSSYGSTGSNYGRSYDRDRYSGSDWNKDRDDDRGFFDRAGDEVKSWFGDEEAERRRRMDERREREHDNDYNRYGSSSSRNTYSGPPYSYGSSSRRDYEW